MAARAERLRRGFVLPTTLLVMTLLTVMLAAAFVLISAEFRTTDNSFAMRKAHALAQAGLHEYLSVNRQLSGASTYDSLRIGFPDGYADVLAQRLVNTPLGAQSLWVVSSRGVLTGPTMSGQTQAQRAVATLANFNPGSLPTPAAFVAANPVVVTGSGTNPFEGGDQCNTVNRPFLLVKNGDYTGPGVPATLSTRSAVLDSTHIDWAALRAGDFTPDYLVPAWPAWSGYPVGLANGNLVFTSMNGGGGTGILVIAGNLTLLSGQWDGIMLVGGTVKKPAGSTALVRGMVVSGLDNLIAPNSVGPDSIEQGSIAFQWNSCVAQNVIRGLSGLTPVRGSWIDTWSF